MVTARTEAALRPVALDLVAAGAPVPLAVLVAVLVSALEVSAPEVVEAAPPVVVSDEAPVLAAAPPVVVSVEAPVLEAAPEAVEPPVGTAAAPVPASVPVWPVPSVVLLPDADEVLFMHESSPFWMVISDEYWRFPSESRTRMLTLVPGARAGCQVYETSLVLSRSVASGAAEVCW